MFGFCISFNVCSFIEILDISFFGTKISLRNCVIAIFVIKIMADLVSSRLMI